MNVCVCVERAGAVGRNPGECSVPPRTDVEPGDGIRRAGEDLELEVGRPGQSPSDGRGSRASGGRGASKWGGYPREGEFR